MIDRRIVVDGDLAISGPGVSLRLGAGADGSPTLVVEGRSGVGLRVGRAAIRRAADAGLALRVADARGRTLVVIDPDRRSVLGRLLFGTDRARPTFRGLIAVRRGAAAQQTEPSIEHGGMEK